MRLAILRRLRDRFVSREPGKDGSRLVEHMGPDEIAAEFTTEELMEFLEGDIYPTEADPRFKEQLRQDLWRLVQRRYGGSDSLPD